MSTANISIYVRVARLASRAAGIAAIAGSCALVYACSADPRIAEPESRVNAPIDVVANDAETARIQQFLDSRYKSKDVIHSFRTKFGEDVDCIDFYAQSSVRALMAKGEHVEIPRPPPPPPVPDGMDAFAKAVAFNGEPDENGAARSCPDSSIPILRKTVSEIKTAGGLTAYLRARRRPPIHPPAGGNTKEIPGFFHVIAETPLDTSPTPSCGTNGSCWQINDGASPPCANGQPACPSGPIQGGQTVASVYAPTPDPGGHSLTQTWVFSGANTADLNSCTQCTSDCTQSVEMGWMVDPLMYTMNSNSPHLFVYSTQDGYWNTGAYAQEGGPAPNCECKAIADQNCDECLDIGSDPFVAVPIPSGQPQYAPGMTVFTPSTLGSKPNEVTFQTENFGNGTGWMLSLNTITFGNYRSSLFTSPPLPAAGSLANTAQYFWAGGEVAAAAETSYTPTTPAVGEMGSGIGAPLGYKSAAYVRDITYYVPRGSQPGAVTLEPNTIFPIYQSNNNCYNSGFGYGGTPGVGQPAPGGSDWGDYMYFGGLGHACGSFWSLFPGSCDACCTFVPSTIAAFGACPTNLASGQACDQNCLQEAPPPPPTCGE
jgi:Neprosin